MKRLHSNQNGFGFVAIFAVVALLGVVAFAGLRVMNANNQVDSSVSSLTRVHSVPAKIQTSADLTKASAALDATPVDTGVNPDQLDKDLNALL
ncbi:MAG: hypothetical protein ABI602_00120 [Candidatus Saccharibacteria bacterium]